MNANNRKSGKVAVIHALIPTRAEIDASGRGRSVRTAATRALLNLLGHKLLRQQRVSNLQLQLSIGNLPRPGMRAER